jgi:uncharacterized protein with NRDE domain
MCLILFAYQQHPVYKLIVAANRDESYLRPTASTHFWDDTPEILAGRDLEKMGTWMGVTKDGRFSALTNYRNPKEITTGKKSRGELVSGALKFKGDVRDYMESLSTKSSLYPGYNLLAGDGNTLYYYSNIGQQLKKLEPGIYGVSNHLLDSEWPKVTQGKNGLEQIIKDREKLNAEDFFTLLSNADPAPDELLPSTGVPLEMERLLSPLFIKSEGYGTRSSTVLLMSDTEVKYVERVFDKEGTGNIQEYSFSYK